MKTGLSEVKASIDKQKEKQALSNTRSANYFRWKNGDKKIVRFLTDDVITVRFYEYVVGSDEKPHDFLYSPDVFGEGTEDFVLKYGGKSFEKGLSGPLVEPRAIERTVGLAVLREEIPAVGGSQLRDNIVELEVGDATFRGRWFGIIKQAHGNFWHQLIHLGMRYGTLCDRDYEITREGEKLDTKYSIIPLDPDPELKDVEHLQKFYGYGKRWDNEDKDRFLYCPQTLPQWAENYAGEERVKFFLTPKEEQQSSSNGNDEFHPATTLNPVEDEAQAELPTNTNFGDLKTRLEEQLQQNKPQ